MRRGFTLLELLIASLLLATLAGLVWGLLSLGSGQFYRGGRKTDAMQSALLVLEELADDLGRMVVTPQFAREPVRISKDRRSIAFSVFDRARTTDRVVAGSSVVWTLAPGPLPGTVVPVRNGQPRPALLLRDWELTFFSMLDPVSHGRDYVRIAVEATGADATGTHASVQLVELRDSRLMASLSRTYPVPAELLSVPAPAPPPELPSTLVDAIEKSRRDS